MSLRRSADWRDRASADLMSRALRRSAVHGDVLVMLDNLPGVAASVAEAGALPHLWHRFARAGRSASAWPPAGPFDAAALRLPKAKNELEMAVHAAASVLRGGALLWVYGSNDEGAGSAHRIIEPVMGPARTVASGGRCRVVEAVREVDAPRPKGTLDEWRQSTLLQFPDGPRKWISYPGVFAAGRLDEGTRVLLDALKTIPVAGWGVLDFACGSGVIGGFLSALEPTVRVDLLDVDAVALRAAGENVPGARLICSDGFDALSRESYDLIVSNPPYHEGKAQTAQVVERLVREAPSHLAAGGTLVFVTQRRLSLGASIESTFDTVEVLLDSGPHRVWLGKK